MHRGAFTRSNKLKLAAVLGEKLLAGVFGNSLAPQKSRLFPTKFLFHDFFKKHKEYIFLKQVPIQKLSSPHCDEMRVEKSGGADDERQLKNSAPPAPHEYADKCVTSVPERLELYGEARPKPPTGELFGWNPGRS